MILLLQAFDFIYINFVFNNESCIKNKSKKLKSSPDANLKYYNDLNIVTRTYKLIVNMNLEP